MSGAGNTALRRVIRGGAINLAAAVLGAALNVGLVAVVTRAFPRETAGVFFSATSIFLMVAALANLGTSNALVYFVARARALGAAELLPRVLRLALGPVAGVSVLVSAALLVAAPELAQMLGHTDAASYLRLLAVFLPCAVLADATLAATRGHHDMRATAALDKVARPLAQLALLSGVAATGTAGLLVVAWAGPYLPVALLAWWWLWWILRGTRRQAARQRAADREPETAGEVAGEVTGVDARSFWSFALPRSVASIAQIGLQRSGIVLVAMLQGAVGAAVFTAATRFMVAGQFATHAVQLAVQPRMAELLTLQDRASANALYQLSTTWLICLSWPVYLPMLVFAPLLMRVFGSGYSTGSGVLVVISVAMMLSASCGMADLVLTMAGHSGWSLFHNVLAFLLNVALCLLLVPPFGVLGAALAWGLAVGARNLLPLLRLSRLMGLRPWDGTAVVAMGVSVAWLGLLPLCCRILLGSGAATLMASVAVGGTGYAVTLWWLRRPLNLDALGWRPR